MKRTRWLFVSLILFTAIFTPQVNAPAMGNHERVQAEIDIPAGAPLTSDPVTATTNLSERASVVYSPRPVVEAAFSSASVSRHKLPVLPITVGRDLAQVSTALRYGWMNPTGCEVISSLPCAHLPVNGLPKTPAGYSWKRLEGRYTFSSYAHPGEDAYMGDLIGIPGISGLYAKEGFLFGVDGLGMQGGGYILRQNNHHEMEKLYIRFIAGHWELHGTDVVITEQWVYANSSTVVSPDLVAQINLADGRFALDIEPALTPYYSIAAPSRFKIGTMIYVPGLAAYGGLFEVQDRGGAFGKDSQRFDIYVGNDMDKALEWIRLGPARSDLVVYMLEKN